MITRTVIFNNNLRALLPNIPKSYIGKEVEVSLHVKKPDDEGDSKEAILKNVKAGLAEIKKAKKGKLKTTPARDFLDEL